MFPQMNMIKYLFFYKHCVLVDPCHIDEAVTVIFYQHVILASLKLIAFFILPFLAVNRWHIKRSIQGANYCNQRT